MDYCNISPETHQPPMKYIGSMKDHHTLDTGVLSFEDGVSTTVLFIYSSEASLLQISHHSKNT